MSNYETALAQMYALGHELAQTPSHKFDLAHIRVLLAALGHPENRFPTVSDRRHQRQGFDGRHSGVHPAGFRAEDRTLYVTASGSHQ
jgi:hypothetical protein